MCSGVSSKSFTWAATDCSTLNCVSYNHRWLVNAGVAIDGSTRLPSFPPVTDFRAT